MTSTLTSNPASTTTSTGLDHRPRPGVESSMAVVSRPGVASLAPLVAAVFALAIALTVGGAACGGKDKNETNKPGSSGTVTTEKTGETETMDGDDDPVAPWENGSSGSGSSKTSDDEGKSSDKGDGTSGDGGDGTSGDGGDGAVAGKDGAQTDEPPPIQPPDLDLSAADQKERVTGHLRNAWRALRGGSKDPDLAIREARLALAADATNIDAIVVIAHAYYTKRLYDTAEVVLDMTFKERRAAKTNPGIYHVYGLIYDRTDRPERAFLAYQKAVELAPGYKSALVNLGTHYLRNKNYDRAQTVYEKLTGELKVQSAITWTNLGSSYRGNAANYPAESPRRGELLRKAEVAYKRALDADGKYANVYYNLGLLYYDADPFPGPGGQPLDKLERLERAKTYFDEYRVMSGADVDLVNRRTKDVAKLIKREKKKRERAKKGDDDDW